MSKYKKLEVVKELMNKNFNFDINNFTRSIYSQVVSLENKALVEAIRKYAEENNIHELILINEDSLIDILKKAKAFDAISEYIIDYEDCICIDSLFYDDEAQAIREALNNE